MHILLNFDCVPLKRCKLATLRHTSFLYAPLRQNSSRKICKAVLPWRTLQAGDVSASRCFLGPGYQPKTLSVSRRAGYLRDSRIGLRLCGEQEKQKTNLLYSKTVLTSQFYMHRYCLIDGIPIVACRVRKMDGKLQLHEIISQRSHEIIKPLVRHQILCITIFPGKKKQSIMTVKQRI